jgi:aquaporin Z
MKKYIAEFVGTLVLVLVACGTAIASSCQTTTPGYIATALAFGLVIIAMAYSICKVSGCHINPAVSVSMAISGRMTWLECAKYIVAQILGGIAGAALLKVLFIDFGFKTLGANTFAEPGQFATNTGIAILIEAILTFIFTSVVLGVTENKKHAPVAGIVIGLTLTLVHLIGIPFTGTSVNPARSIGPALFSGGSAMSELWVFILAPILGAIVAGLFYRYVWKNAEE